MFGLIYGQIGDGNISFRQLDSQIVNAMLHSAHPELTHLIGARG
jgi:hypothetical protein